MPKIIFEIRQTPTSVFNNEQESWICMFLVWQMVFLRMQWPWIHIQRCASHTCPGRPDDLANSFSKSSADLICPSCLLMILAQKTQHESRQVGNALRVPCLGEKADIHMEVVKRHLQVAKDGESRDFGHRSCFGENQQPVWPEAQSVLDWLWVPDFPCLDLRPSSNQCVFQLLNAHASAPRDPRPVP